MHATYCTATMSNVWSRASGLQSLCLARIMVVSEAPRNTS
jgi:hypothetical protein